MGDLSERENWLHKLDLNQSRAAAADLLLNMLRSTSAQAWNKTETLLAHEVDRHQIDTTLIDPWAIAKDVHYVYEKALAAYVEDISPQRLSVLISKDLGLIRGKYTAVDPRVIGFVSMQFHYCGQFMLQQVSEPARRVLENYFKVIDDHLYMPLHRAYEAAANYDFGNPRLQTVHSLLPVSSKIAQQVVKAVHQLNPEYVCYTGPLNSPGVRVSSIRDVEMFQIYLWTCVLEEDISAITAELFPLCVMLYPTLKVNWQLVRQMLTQLGEAFKGHIKPQHIIYYQPYYQALWKMFSPAVFPDEPGDGHIA